MRLALVMVFGLAGCGGGVICGEGTTPGPDGVCIPNDVLPDDTDEPVEEDPPDLADLLLDAQPCDPLPAGERLAPIDGCADDICAKTTLRDAIEAAGRMPECGPGPAAAWLACRFPSGVVANVYDGNEDGEPQGFETVWWVSVQPPFGGSSPDGLGLGISPGCFVAAFGKPDTVTLYEGPDGKPQMAYGYWEDVGVVARDQLGGPQPYQPDGRVDEVSLYGPPDEGR